MAISLSLFAGAGWQFFDNNGLPLAGGKLYTYEAGGATPLTTYTSSSGGVSNTNPIVLDSAGRVPNEIWINTTQTAKFVLFDTTGSTLIGTWDNIPSVASAISTGVPNGIAYFNNFGVFGSSSNLTFYGDNLYAAGSISAGGSLLADQDATIDGNLIVGGYINAGGQINAGGDVNVDGWLYLNGDGVYTSAYFRDNVNVNGQLNVTGNVGLPLNSYLASNPTTNDSTNRIATTAFCNPAATLASPGSVTLPSGIIIKWGSVSATIGTGGTITFSSAFSSLYTATATLNYGGSCGYILYPFNQTNTGFTYGWNYFSTTGNGQACIINYIAIGV